VRTGLGRDDAAAAFPFAADDAAPVQPLFDVLDEFVCGSARA
jgi:hypothetical protein